MNKDKIICPECGKSFFESDYVKVLKDELKGSDGFATTITLVCFFIIFLPPVVIMSIYEYENYLVGAISFWAAIFISYYIYNRLSNMNEHYKISKHTGPQYNLHCPYCCHKMAVEK